MINFKDLGIKPAEKPLSGEKVKPNKILNLDIIVHDFRIEDSKFYKGTKCLCLGFELNGIRNVVFMQGNILVQTIQQIPIDKFPFTTKIIKENGRYEFS
jgi:hypothetical protein